MLSRCSCTASLSYFFFFNDTATTEIYTLSLHDALPISADPQARGPRVPVRVGRGRVRRAHGGQRVPERHARDERVLGPLGQRSEEHTSELQSRLHLVCRLLLEKKKKKKNTVHSTTHASL